MFRRFIALALPLVLVGIVWPSVASPVHAQDNHLAAGSVIENSEPPCVYQDPERDGKTVCPNTTFRGAVLENVDLAGACLSGSTFDLVQYHSVNLEGADLPDSKFRATFADGAILKNAVLDRSVVLADEDSAVEVGTGRG